MDKKALRQQIRLRKREMTEGQIVRASVRLGQLLEQSECYRQAKTVYFYLPYNQEVRTKPMIEKAWTQGKRVAVPKVYGEEMRFIYLTDFSQIAPGSFGIPEPIADGPVAQETDALVLMPGMAFDPQGHRIGYGGGFYDKFLSAEPNHPTVALCYDFQLLDRLDTEEFDIPVDLVLSAPIGE